MNPSLDNKMGWVALPGLPSYVEYQASDKRNRNPNWTDAEITRFLIILMEEPVLNDLNAQRNKQVFCYVSRKMAGEGCEKTWDQCRVKLKNLKSQWRYVKDRLPGIEEADLNEEETVRQLMHECQARGVSPSCIKHLRLLKQFLLSLNAVKRGASPLGPGIYPLPTTTKVEPDAYPEEEETYEETDARLVVETGISPPSSPAHRDPGNNIQLERESQGQDPLEEETSVKNHLRVISPQDINSSSDTNKRPADPEIQSSAKRLRPISEEATNSSTAESLQRFQTDMVDRFLAFQRESEVRFLAWEQERWRMEQSMLDRWRTEQRAHDKEMFSMFCNLLSQCSQAILENRNN